MLRYRFIRFYKTLCLFKQSTWHVLYFITETIRKILLQGLQNCEKNVTSGLNKTLKGVIFSVSSFTSYIPKWWKKNTPNCCQKTNHLTSIISTFIYSTTVCESLWQELAFMVTACGLIIGHISDGVFFLSLNNNAVPTVFLVYTHFRWSFLNIPEIFAFRWEGIVPFSCVCSGKAITNFYCLLPQPMIQKDPKNKEFRLSPNYRIHTGMCCSSIFFSCSLQILSKQTSGTFCTWKDAFKDPLACYLSFYSHYTSIVVYLLLFFSF